MGKAANALLIKRSTGWRTAYRAQHLDVFFEPFFVRSRSTTQGKKERDEISHHNFRSFSNMMTMIFL